MKKPQTALKTAAALALAAGFAIGTAHAADVAKGKELVESHNCAACHGAKLDNPINAEYPRLAGQHADYLVWAMRQYQMGLTNPLLGRNNAIMQAQVQSLSVADMKDIAAYLESLQGSLVFKK
ncbi:MULTISPECIES: c-type cytochrome [Burkholderia]|uniref:Cytochrome C n=4 Tax=pseudomallei group TaxID=111527 RepID=A0A1B4G4Q4_9BURK|nr:MULTISPECIES: c-type cytochrome [Burkholderia]ABC36455.1 cytochrome c family protein [Burkholderia thailandensis E264]AHI65241.1 cytochrome c family protein [Burkholderia thailandensis H0587]AHI74053.1 cytochrome c family protein [Burkholderia thailandensis 2002721723]AHI80214.1 cytochrome c family protein [Burkholderia thailandensis E444]AIC87716.1 cytochrome c family protein [Burkholderia thailandensis USAMRU Malaysia \